MGEQVGTDGNPARLLMGAVDFICLDLFMVLSKLLS